MLVIGGAQEALDAKQGTYEMTLYRNGFVRQALIYGASLVPVISFGETDVFDVLHNPPGSLLRTFQELMKRYTGVAPVIFKGRQMFNPNGSGVFPIRSPIVSVVGAPIKCPKIGPDVYTDKKYESIVNEYHAKYVMALKELWNKNKTQYARKRLSSLHLAKAPN